MSVEVAIATQRYKADVSRKTRAAAAKAETRQVVGKERGSKSGS